MSPKSEIINEDSQTLEWGRRGSNYWSPHPHHSKIENRSILSSFSTKNQIETFHKIFYQNQITNEDV